MVVTALSLLLDKEANLQADGTRQIPGKPFSTAEARCSVGWLQQILEVYPTRGPGPRGADPTGTGVFYYIVRGLTPWMRRNG